MPWKMTKRKRRERERGRERDLKLIEVYEHRLSINTNFSSKAGYASRINITIDAELGVVKVPFFSPSPPSSSSCTRAWKCYQAFPLLWNPSFVHANDPKGRNCSWKLQLDSFLCRVSEGFRIPAASRAHPVPIVKTGCENLWKTKGGWKWWCMIESGTIVSFFFLLFLRDSSILLTPILWISCFYRDIVAGDNICRFNIL